MSLCSRFHIYLLLCSALPLSLLIAGCSEEPQQPKKIEQQKHTVSLETGCKRCHPVHLDKKHDLACISCHGGNPEGTSPEAAHEELVTTPAHPESMAQSCGKCHAEQVEAARRSLHFTLHNEVNTVRKAFGAEKDLSSLTDIPIHQSIDSALDVADDMLRRRCLKCHVYSEGDVYPETVRATGCAACHLIYKDGELNSHAFVKSPPDSQCLHCHYGNVVGGDYYGRYEHDLNWEYRTPYRTDDAYPRPYGLEYHELQPDTHQKSGMACIDCHSGKELKKDHQSGVKGKITCSSCHQWQQGKKPPLGNLSSKNGSLVLHTRHSDKELVVPQLQHQAHQQNDKAACTVCHAQWTFNDQGTHMIRLDYLDFDPWSRLSVQGSFEVEDQMDLNEYEIPFMRDQLSTIPYLGIWLKGYELRRWETPLIGTDKDGRLQTFRPILDLHLSVVNQDEEVVFDGVGIIEEQRRFLPYTPHTIGKAGAFYQQRLQENLPK